MSDQIGKIQRVKKISVKKNIIHVLKFVLDDK